MPLPIGRLKSGAPLVRRITTAIALLCLANVAVLNAQEQATISRGTVNIALANSNGIILLTDSMQSHQDADGWHYVQPVQKLFRLDDKTVCSIAGFASGTSSAPQLSTDIAGVMADFIDGLAQNPIMDLETKLKAIGFVVGLYIDLIANRREVVLGSGTPPNSYVFEVIVAGYDADGTAKVEKLTLTPRVAEAADGHRYWSHETLLETASLGRGLVSVLGGIRDYSLQALNSPEQFADGSAIREYAESKARDGSASLSLDEMAALAKEMAGQAARKTPFVGGPDQIAVLSGGKISSFDQPPFPRPVQRPLKFALMVGIQVQGGMMMLTPPGVHFLWIRSKFIGVTGPQLRVDGQFFYGCEIRDSMVEWDGGLVDFGPTNTVIDSMMWPGPVIPGFKWSMTPPQGPPLHPMIGPVRP